MSSTESRTPSTDGRQLVPGRPELLDLHGHGPAALGQVGQHPATALLGLFDQGQAPLVGSDDQRLALGLARPPATWRRSAATCSWTPPACDLGLGDPLGRRRLGLHLDVGRLALGLPHERAAASSACRVMRAASSWALRSTWALCWPRAAVSVASSMTGLRARSSASASWRRSSCVALLPGRQLAGHQLEEGAHLVGVESPAHRGEGVAGDLGGRQPRRGDGRQVLGHGQDYDLGAAGSEFHRVKRAAIGGGSGRTPVAPAGQRGRTAAAAVVGGGTWPPRCRRTASAWSRVDTS